MRRLVAAAIALGLALSARAFDPFFDGVNVWRWPSGSMIYHVNQASFGSLNTATVTSAYAQWSDDPIADVTVTRGTNESGAATIAGNDGTNDVVFVSSGWSLGSGVLGVTFVYRDGSFNIVESDMFLNGQDFAWDDPTGAGCSSAFDLQSTVTHEAGHALGLGHSSESDDTCNTSLPAYDPILCDATMYYSGGPCDTSTQTLECDDRAGIRFMYPLGGTPRADWTTEGFSATPAAGAISTGVSVSVAGTARNAGSVSTSSGVAALYVNTTGSLTGATRLSTDATGVTTSCHSQPVSLSHAFTAAQSGTRYLIVRLDDGGSTTEYDESDSSNVVVLGPWTVSSPTPVLVLAPTSLTYAAVQGGAQPAAQAVAVTDGGAGGFNWSAADDAAWITLSRTSGSAGTGFNVSVSPTGLPVGTHDGTITVTATGAQGSPGTIAVRLDVTSGAILQATPVSLTFDAAPNGALPASQSVAVSNGGTGTLSWTASDDQSWMSAAPASGTNAGTVNVSITTTNLAAGTYTGYVTIAAVGAGGSPQTIPVTYRVTNAPPALALSATSLAFSGAVGGAPPASQSVAVTNTGGGTLSFTASSNRSWLAASPGSGAAPASVTVSANGAGLGAGTHVGQVTVTAAGATGSPKTIDVSLTLTTQPSLSASPSTLTFTTPAGSSPAPKTLVVGNDGSASLTYALADDAPWLGVTPSGTTLTGGATRQHAVSVDATGLAAGTYSATITITAPTADDSPKTVPVTLVVGDQPPLVVTPPTLAFAATASQPRPPSQAVAVSTSGATGASWTATADVPWLSLVPASGTGDGSISVSADATGVAFGTRQGRIVVTAAGLAGSPQQVDVTFTVEPGPRLVASPTSLRFSATRLGALPSAQPISIANAGTGSLAWNVGGAPSWLTISPGSGTGDASVSVQPNTTALAAGRFTATLRVGATGAYDAPSDVTVVYDVQGPALVFTPERARFELSGGSFVSASSATILVGDAGTGGAAWTASANAPWVSVAPSSGTAGQQATISLVQPERLRPGAHDAAVVFTSAGASNSPAPVPVTVVVRQAPGLSVFPQRLDLVARAGSVSAAAAELAIDDASDRTGDWTVVSSPPWLLPRATAGAAGARLVLDVDASALGAGAQSGALAIASEGETIAVPVSLRVLAAPRLVAAPASVELLARAGQTASNVTVSIDSIGAGSGAFTATPSAPWLRVTPGSGTAPAALEVGADAASLPAGTHRGSVVVSAGSGDAATIPVTLTVVPSAAALADLDASVGSGCAPLAVTLTDRSTGATSVAWTLDGAPLAGGATASATIAAPGEHEVTLTASNAAGSSIARRTIVVRAPPLAHAGADRTVAFEPDGETRVTLETARAAAAAPARLASLTWTTTAGTFADTGTATTALERPTLVLASSRGGSSATLTLQAADDAGCVSSDSMTLRVRSDVDLDSDTWGDLVDNCPGLANSLQGDQDADGVGSTCDSCPSAFDPAQSDADGSGAGDACETALRTVTIADAFGRACAGEAAVDVAASGAGRVRRLAVRVSGRAPSGAAAAALALASGATALVSPSDAQSVELRAPAGVTLDGSAPLSMSWPLLPGDDVVAVPCASATMGAAGGELAPTCAGGEVRLRPDGDVSPKSAPDGLTNVADAVRLLRASVGLEALDGQDLARADLAPGSVVAGSWVATPDCLVDVSDVVVALRASVGLVTLTR